MRIKWGWEDGYAGRRPRHTMEIPDEDLEGLNGQQRERLIEERVKYEFSQVVTPFWDIDGDGE